MFLAVTTTQHASTIAKAAFAAGAKLSLLLTAGAEAGLHPILPNATGKLLVPGAVAPVVPAVGDPGSFLGYPDVTSFLQAWLPIVFMGLLVVSVFVLLRYMPRTKPVEWQ